MMSDGVQASADAAYQRIVSARAAPASIPSDPNPTSPDTAEAEPASEYMGGAAGEQAERLSEAGAPSATAEGHAPPVDLAQLLREAGNAQSALEKAQQRCRVLQASSAALQIAHDHTTSIRCAFHENFDIHISFCMPKA